MVKENKIELKSINDLLKYNFYIPSYQRGYRWGKRQIIELLDDINEFNNSRKDNGFYCLQPIIVKKDSSQDYYKLIDGQQRLTTIYIILSYLKKKKFAIQYETRERSKEFLESLSDKINDENIDFFHISHAYKNIKDWFMAKKEHEETIEEEFFICLGKYTKIVWYEILNDEIEIDVFTRINSGKIELTEAELIKALFLNKKNFVENEKHLRQIEIAKEWDEIEYTLQNNEFWLFLNQSKDNPTRIELIFDLYANSLKSKSVSPYLFFSEQQNIVKLWAENPENIKKVFLSVKYWFEDRELYHLIGYLIASGQISLKEIYGLFNSNLKSDFKKILYKKIISDIDIEKIEELDYNNDRPKIFRILLLFNIATILTNRNSYLKFSYDKFNEEDWSIEHIHAQQDKGIFGTDRIKGWLINIKRHLNDSTEFSLDEKVQSLKSELLIEIDSVLEYEKISWDDEKYQSLQAKIFAYFGDEPDVNSLDNLALLSSKVNSSLSNNIFSIKREILINKDKTGEFVPLCTKNVFLKYYSKDANNLHFWSRKDRECYVNEIKNILINFGYGKF